MAVTKQNTQQPVQQNAMAQAMAQAQTQEQALAQDSDNSELADQIAAEQERAALLQQQLLQQMAHQMAQQMVQQMVQQAPAPAVAPAKVNPELDQRLMAVLTMCPYETKDEARNWAIDILGCKPRDFEVTEASLEQATTKARAYLVKLSKRNKELKNELLAKEAMEALGIFPPKETVSPAVYRPASQITLAPKPLFERPVRTYSPPQEVYVVKESQLRSSSQNTDFWEDAITVAAGVAVAGVVGYGIYKLVEHFMED